MADFFPTSEEAWCSYQSAHSAFATQEADKVATDRETDRDSLGDACESTEPDSACILEIRETYRRLQGHFQLFGFLTSASFDGFMARVISPHTRVRRSLE